MLKFFHRKRLVEQGLACGKSRRAQPTHDLGDLLESAGPVRAIILLLFVLGLAALIFSGTPEEPMKKFLICLLILATAVVQLWMNHPGTWALNSRLLLVFGTLFTQLAAIKLVVYEVDIGAIPAWIGPLLMPYALAPLILSVLLGKNHGLYAAVFVSLWGAMLQPPIDPVFLVISLITGFSAVYATVQVRRRSRLIRAGVYVGVATLALAAIFGLIGPIRWEALGATNWQLIGIQAGTAIGIGFATAVVVSGILPMLENLFAITTDISWLELADLNHPLLRRLSIEAPGTYHHSLAVANLAEAAAEKVGANGCISRVSSYFHDIGKLVKPEYFAENMRPGESPHDDLTPTMSALIIIAHVKEGVDLALKHRLNQRIIDVIQQHHGTSLVSFFYRRALRQQEDAKLGGKIMNLREEDVPEVKESSFRYPGPRPQTKESAIISLADAVESASRSLERPTPQRVEDLIHDIIQDRILDGQLDDAPLTLSEIRQISASFRHTLTSMMHTRIAYPKREEKTRSGHGPDRRGAPASAA